MIRKADYGTMWQTEGLYTYVLAHFAVRQNLKWQVLLMI